MHSLEMKLPQGGLQHQSVSLKGAPKHNNPKSTNPPKKKFKLSGSAARDKLMAIRDSDDSSLDTESDSESLTSLQE